MSRIDYGGTRYSGALRLPTTAPIGADLAAGALWLDTAMDPDRLYIRNAAGNNTDIRQNSDLDPVDHGYKAWAGDPATFNNTVQSLVSGSLVICRIPLPRTITVANVDVVVTTAGVTVAATGNRMRLYDSTGTQLASSNELLSWNAGRITWTLGAAIVIAGGPGSFVYGSIQVNATTPPKFARMPPAATSAMANQNISTLAGGYRSASATGQTATSIQNLPAMTAINDLIWFGLR